MNNVAELKEKIKELKSLKAEINGDKVKLYRGGNVSESKLKKLRYNDYLSLVKEGTDATGNLGASAYGNNIVEIEVPIKDIRISNGEIQYIGDSESLKGGEKYPQKIYRAYNDVYGSNYTAEEIDRQDNVRSIAYMGLSGGKREFDELVDKWNDTNDKTKPSNPEIKSTLEEESVNNDNIEQTTHGGYAKRGIKSAMQLIKEEPDGNLSNYNKDVQEEWFGKFDTTNRYKTPVPENGEIILYRATRKGDIIKPGDYVTENKNYAKDHIKDNLGGIGKITQIKATLRDIYPADGPHEFWYVPKSLEKFNSVEDFYFYNQTEKQSNSELNPINKKIEVIEREEPSLIEGKGKHLIRIKDHPEIYTDGHLLIEDRTSSEVKKWLENQKIYSTSELEYTKVGNLYSKGKSVPVKFLGYEQDPDFDFPFVHLDIGDEKSEVINAEYYQWLKKEGYIIKSTGKHFKPLVLERNGKDVGLLTSLNPEGLSKPVDSFSQQETKQSETDVDGNKETNLSELEREM